MSTTKRDKTRQFEEARPPELAAPQLAAVDALIGGGTDSEAAQAAGVHRSTLHAWKRHNPAFIAALNARREELWSSSRERLRSLLPAALGRVEAEIANPESPGGLRAALKVVEAGLGFAGEDLKEHGPADPGQVLDGMARARRPGGTMEELLANLDDGGPATDEERRAALEELRGLGAFE